MEQVRHLATLGRAAREEAGIKVRQPLSRLVCVVPKSAGQSLETLVSLLRAELNVKQVDFASSADALVTLEAKPNFRTLGKKFGANTKLAAQAVEALSSDALRRFEHGEPLAVSVGNDSHQLAPEDITIRRRASGDFVVAEGEGFFAALDPAVTPELRAEGIARELVSRIQRMRKDAGFAVSDRITVAIAGSAEVEQAVRQFQEWIAEEVLARTVAVGAAGAGNDHAAQTVDLDGLTAHVAINKES